MTTSSTQRSLTDRPPGGPPGAAQRLAGQRPHASTRSPRRHLPPRGLALRPARPGRPRGAAVEHRGAARSHNHRRRLVWAVIVGMFLLVLWKGLEALLGHRDETDSGKRTRKRVASAFKGGPVRRRGDQRGSGRHPPAAAATGRRLVDHLDGDGDGLAGRAAHRGRRPGDHRVQRLPGLDGVDRKFAEKLDAGVAAVRADAPPRLQARAATPAKGLAIGLVGACSSTRRSPGPEVRWPRPGPADRAPALRPGAPWADRNQAGLLRTVHARPGPPPVPLSAGPSR